MAFTTKSFYLNYKKSLGSALVVIALPVFNILGVAPASPFHDDAAHVQRAIQLAHERELLGADANRFLASDQRKVDQVNAFVAKYAARSLQGVWKKQSKRVAREIIDSSLRHGFDPILLLAVIENESRFRPTIVGAYGEIGLMQLKPDTAEEIAQKINFRWRGPNTLRDPVANIHIGAAYLSMLRAKFGFDKDLYLAAYNMGARNVSRLLSDNCHPQVYPKKTIEHYAKIYTEFMNDRGAVAGPYAAL